MDFLCNECAKSFAKEVDLVVHQLRAHDKRPFSCPVCKENFIGKDTQRNHMRKHNKKKETTKKILTCSSCTYETPHKQNLNRHVKTHDNEKVNGASMFCPECGNSFPAKKEFDKTPQNSSEENIAKCPETGRESKIKHWIRNLSQRRKGSF